MKKKTITEAELHRMVHAGMTHAQIAATLGRHAATVAATCHVLGILSPSGKGAWDGEGRGNHDLQGYLADMRSGLTVREIAVKHRRQQSTVTQALKRAGLPTSVLALMRAEAAQKGAPAPVTFTADRFATFVGPLAA